MEIIIPLFSPSHVYIKQKLKLLLLLCTAKKKEQKQRETEIDFQMNLMSNMRTTSLKELNVNLQYILKYGFQKKISFCSRCSSFLSPTFVEIKNSFTRTLLTFNSKKFGIICYRKNTDQNEPIICFIAL